MRHRIPMTVSTLDAHPSAGHLKRALLSFVLCIASALQLVAYHNRVIPTRTAPNMVFGAYPRALSAPRPTPVSPPCPIHPQVIWQVLKGSLNNASLSSHTSRAPRANKQSPQYASHHSMCEGLAAYTRVNNFLTC